jgi:hypothetical protein
MISLVLTVKGVERVGAQATSKGAPEETGDLPAEPAVA